MSFLKEKKEQKLEKVEDRKNNFPLDMFRGDLTRANHSFIEAIRGKNQTSLIAEFKKSSPSKGTINKEASLEEFISLYDRHADCVSILTDNEHFSGEIGFLKQAKAITKKPVLRKDFILDEYQVYEARYFGADAVLLIAGLVPLEKLRGLVALADSLGMDSLVECHDEEDLNGALASGSKLIGINNRNLDSLEEDFQNTFKLLSKIPEEQRKELVIVSESSIHGAKEIRKLRGLVDAALVGTAIMSCSVPEVKLKELAGKTLVKVCGVTLKEDALQALLYGADFIGLNFYKESPRFVDLEKAKEIADVIRGKAIIAGVFVNEEKERVEKIANAVGLDILQFSGTESKEYVKEFLMPVIKAVHVKNKKDVSKLAEFDADYLMIDAFNEGEFGGTGKTIDKELLDAEQLAELPIVFSGGLNPKNVKEIVKEFRPVIVDVCSGVEEKPGGKSFSKMKDFISNAKGVLE